MVILFPFLSSHLKKREEEKEEELAKIVIKNHTFQPGHKILILHKLGHILKLQTT
jgi:hypothetical protein